MNHHLFPLFSLLLSLGVPALAATEPPVPGPDALPSPLKAAEIMWQEKNWDHVIAASIIAVTDPQARQTVNDFFARQATSRVNDYRKTFEDTVVPGSMDDSWKMHFFIGLNPLLQAIAATDDPEQFGVFETVAKCGLFPPQDIAASFSQYLQEGSPMEGWFLDYAAHALAGQSAAEIFLHMNSRPAFDRLIKMLDEHPGMGVGLGSFSNRYDPRLVTLYLRAMDGRMGSVNRVPLVAEFFAPGGGDISRQPLETADSVVYPQIRRFIEEAEKYDVPSKPYPAQVRQYIIDAKAKLRALEIQHPPPPLPEVPDDHGAIPFVPVPVNVDLYHFESNMNPPFPWQAKILIVITVLFTGWRFWAEWRTFGK